MHFTPSKSDLKWQRYDQNDIQIEIIAILGGDDKIKILELDFLHLHEGVGHKMMKFGENQSSLA